MLRPAFSLTCLLVVFIAFALHGAQEPPRKAEIDQGTPEKAFASLVKVCELADVDGYVSLLPPEVQAKLREDLKDTELRRDYQTVLKVLYLALADTTIVGVNKSRDGKKAFLLIRPETPPAKGESETISIEFALTDKKWYYIRQAE